MSSFANGHPTAKICKKSPVWGDWELDVSNLRCLQPDLL